MVTSVICALEGSSVSGVEEGVDWRRDGLEAEAKVPIWARTQVQTLRSAAPPKDPASPSPPPRAVGIPPANLFFSEPLASCNYMYFSLCLAVICLSSQTVPHTGVCLTTPGMQVLQVLTHACVHLLWLPYHNTTNQGLHPQKWILTVLEARSRWRCQQGRAPAEGSREEPSCLFQTGGSRCCLASGSIGPVSPAILSQPCFSSFGVTLLCLSLVSTPVIGFRVLPDNPS